MPPKKAAGGGGPSKKTVEKKKDKVLEDKTFGLKNKKGKKQQDFIKCVTQQVKFGNKTAAQREQDERERKDKKKELEKLKAEELALFKPVQSQKVSAGADPKSVLCAFHKQGLCKKGDKCKFSHDLTLERKGEKRSLYVDERGELENDTMDTWDQTKLEAVVSQKHGSDGPKPTEIVCKHFLDAIDRNLYGWFWACPAGGEKCHYRHALPPGFVLKKDQKKAAEKQNEISIEELVETERQALGSHLNKITLESFMEWKKRKVAEKKRNLAKDMAKKKSDFKAGRALGVSGREMFMFNPELVTGDDDGAEEVYTRRGNDSDDSDDEEGGGGACAAAASTVHEGPTYDLTNIGAVGEARAPARPLDCAPPSAAVVAAAAGAADVVVDEDLFGDEDLGDLDLDDEDLGDEDDDDDDVR